MIRAVLISVAFLGLTLGLILMQPSQDKTIVQDDTYPQDDQVSRAQNEFEALQELSGGIDNLSSSLADIRPEPRPATEPATPFATVAPAEVQAPAPLPDPARVLSAQPAPALSEPPAQAASDLERLIVNALTQGQSEAYIDALVNDAARKGAVEVPETLITEDGRVDTTSLLMVLSAGATGPTPGQDYEVQPGDSLASISYRFYGRTDHAVDIYNANRDVLRSPAHLEVGVTLKIPVL